MPEGERVLRVEVGDLAPGETRAVGEGEEEVLLCNVAGQLFAVANRCTHARVALTEALLEGTSLECPVHGACFDVETGKVLSLPARRALRTYPVTVEGSEAVIDLG